MELRRIAPVIRFVTIVTALKLTVVSCVPMKYEIGYRNSIDLDAEQTEARYDQGMLSDIMNDDRAASELQKAESCVADNFKYDHGQKIQRYDPCEICLCIDGEIFCWWKQCDVPEKPNLSGNPAVDTTSSNAAAAAPRLQLTNPSSSTTLPPPPSSDQQLSQPYQGYSGSSSMTTTTTSSAIPSTTTNNGGGAAVPQELSVAGLPTSTTPDDAGGTVRILHPPPPEAIPQNILSFPQTPPIMMYRPVAPPAVKNGTNSGSVAIPLLSASEQRNKHRTAKKVNPLNHGKKSFRKSSSSSQRSKVPPPYVINYGHGIDGNTASMVPSMTERITSGPPVSFDEVAGRLTVGDRNDGRKSEEEEDDEEEDDDDDEEDDEGSAEAELRGQIYDGGAARSDGAGKMDGNRAGSKGDIGGGAGGQFGGYGYGMFKEPDEDKQQHYIITSSGHVEMFDDDTSMEPATENAFGLNRFPTGGSGTGGSSSTTGQPVAGAEGGDHAVPPLITMTTNVTTQNWNYSCQQLAAADSGSSGQGTPPLTPFVPLAGGSVIDVLNSTTLDGGGNVGGVGLDYLDDNQTELIYPAVPGLTGEGESAGSNSRRGGSDRQTAGSVTSTTTTSVGVAGTSDMVASLTTSSSTSSGGAGRAVEKQEKHCVVMGVSYKVGSVLKQETGNCLHCVCVAGPENDPVPRVTCTPLNCPPLILPDILDGAGF